MTLLQRYVTASQATMVLFATFIAGVIAALLVVGATTLSVFQTERNVGQCETACACRAYQFVRLTNNDECLCSFQGKQETVDVDEPAD